MFIGNVATDIDANPTRADNTVFSVERYTGVTDDERTIAARFSSELHAGLIDSATENNNICIGDNVGLYYSVSVSLSLSLFLVCYYIFHTIFFF